MASRSGTSGCRLQREVIAAFSDLVDAKPEDIAAKMEGIVDRVITEGDLAVTREERQKLVDQMIHDVTGFGPIEPFLKDETITEVMVNGPNQIYIERAGKLERVDTSFLNDEHVLQVIDRIITPMGRRIDEMSPRVDARLPDGSRVNAIIAPLSLVGPVITVRKFSHTPYTVKDLIRFGTATPQMFQFLKACIEARLNIFVSGGTGSGKTTDAECPLLVHPERRADRHDRGRRRAADAPGARADARVTPGQPRRRRRDHDPGPAAERDAHAARPDHRRRVSSR